MQSIMSFLKINYKPRAWKRLIELDLELSVLRKGTIIISIVYGSVLVEKLNLRSKFCLLLFIVDNEVRMNQLNV